MDSRRRRLCSRLQHLLQIILYQDQAIPPPDSAGKGVMPVIADVWWVAHSCGRACELRTHHARRQQERSRHRKRSVHAGGSRVGEGAGLRVRRSIGKKLHQRREGLLRRGSDTAQATRSCIAAAAAIDPPCQRRNVLATPPQRSKQEIHPAGPNRRKQMRHFMRA